MKILSLRSFACALLAIIVACGFTSSAFAKSWEDAISDIEAKADKFWEYGKSRGAFTFLGTSFNEIGIPQHECAILGRMLGFQDYIQHLEEIDHPELSENLSQDEIQQLMYHAHFLRNWALVARRLVETPDEERRHIWNLNCVGNQGIPESLFVGLNDPAAKLIVDGNEIRVLGDFDAGFFERFEQLVQANPQVERIVLGSGGGSVRDAIMTGLLIRERGLTTTLSDNCYSACPLAFLGGVRRIIWSPYPKLGFHRISRPDGTEVSFDDPAYGVIEDYVARMGADPDFIMRHIFAASPREFSYPKFENLCRSAATTWIQRLCSSDNY